MSKQAQINDFGMQGNKTLTRKRKTSQKASVEPQRDMFSALIEKTIGRECVLELRFHPTRKWRFDYAIPSARVAIEIDGGLFLNRGRHSGSVGQLNDFEKFNEAAAYGWRVLHFTPDQRYTAETLNKIQRAVEWSERQNCDNK